MEITSLRVTVVGRPAPQGSKTLGAHGQMREQSPYLAAWRARVKEDVYWRYRELGVGKDDLPLFRGPVQVHITFLVDSQPDCPPDLDKLQRGVWDALTAARVWEDDGRVVWCQASKRSPEGDEQAGAYITVTAAP